MKPEINRISISSSTVARLLGAAAFLLLLASIIGRLAKFIFGHDTIYGLIDMFDIDREQNIPTYFSALLMLFAAQLLAIISVLGHKRRTSHVMKWAVLSLGFIYMALDEVFELHERLIEPFRALLGNDNLGFFYYAWVIPGIAVVAGLALYFRRFLTDLSASTRRRFATAATAYIAGAIGMELIGGWYAEANGVQNLTYNIIVTIEEGLEMAGLVIFIWALLKHCADEYKEVTFRIVDR